MRLGGLVLVTALLMAACAGSGGDVPSTEVSASGGSAAASEVEVVEPDTGYAETADGTRISFRDWGGDGPPVVLLTGLGDTAAVYDDFASRLVDEYRVVGVSRRGFGESDQPVDGYDYATRTADDLAVLDHLDIDRAVFLGHSIAGDELVTLAAEHPSRTAGVVFLDAAGPTSEAAPDCVRRAELWMPGWEAGSDDPVQASIDQAEEIFGFAVPDSFRTAVEASFTFDGGNRTYTGSTGARQSIDEYSVANPQDYGTIAVPALSLAALSDTLQTAFPWMEDDRIPEPDRDDAQACTTDVVVPEQRATFDAIAVANPDIDAQLWEETHHYLFLQQPDRTVDAVKDWLQSKSW